MTLPLSEFFELTRSSDIRAVFTKYQKAGGDRALLSRLLFLLWLERHAESSVPPRTRKALLTRCEISLEDVLMLPGLPDSLRRPLRQALQTIGYFKQGQTGQKRVRRPGRPKGHSLASLVVASISYEFRRLSGSAAYKDILILVQAVAPETFPPATTTPEHLRQRARGLPAKVVRDLLTNL